MCCRDPIPMCPLRNEGKHRQYQWCSQPLLRALSTWFPTCPGYALFLLVLSLGFTCHLWLWCSLSSPDMTWMQLPWFCLPETTMNRSPCSSSSSWLDLLSVLHNSAWDSSFLVCASTKYFSQRKLKGRLSETHLNLCFSRASCSSSILCLI